jgi:hypothetical protein
MCSCMYVRLADAGTVARILFALDAQEFIKLRSLPENTVACVVSDCKTWFDSLPDLFTFFVITLTIIFPQLSLTRSFARHT